MGKTEEDLLRFRAVVENETHMVFFTDRDGVFTYVNRSFERITGYAAADVLGKRCSILKSCLMDPGYYGRLWERLLSGGNWSEEIINRKKDGSFYYAHQIIVPVMDPEGAVDGFVAIQDDVTTQRDLEREILHLSVTDHLTGILNRERFMDLLAEEMERSVRYGHPLSLIMFDIDCFRTINEAYGHEAGDRVLRAIVDLTRTCLRRTDNLSRWGGEEFVILSVETDLRGAMKLADRIRELVAETEILPGRRITISCGVVQYNAGSDTPDGLVKYADDSLYAAKGNGRNRVEAIRR